MLRSHFVQQLLAELPALMRAARRLTRSEADAEDLVQATLERALERRGDLRAPEKLRAWLLQIQRSVSYNGARGLRHRFEVLEGGRTEVTPAEPRGDLEAEILERSFADDVHRALEGLPAEWREALLLREVEGLSYDEIGEVLACPIGTVRSRLARARASLLERLSENRNESWQDAIKSGSRAYPPGTTAK
jgi:RNA polymerase sigma-70 factor (ECF subfamily)